MEPIPVSAAPAKVSGYLATLDGWRAIAILAVIVAHDRVYHVGRFSTQWFKDYGANAGVTLFFALSGLLICSRLLQEERLRGTIDLRGFYLRRFFRIQPAALMYLIALFVLMSTGVIFRHYDDLLSALFFVRNYVHPHPVEESWYTAHFWSLAIEEHFYLILPGFLVWCKRFRAVTLGGLVVAIEIVRALTIGRSVLSYQTDFEADAIILSACVAIVLTEHGMRAWCHRWIRPWVAVAVTAAVWARVMLHHSRTDHTLFISTFPLLVVSTMLHPRSLLGRMLELRALRFIGLISYSLYLWQQMFLITDFAVPTPGWAGLAYVQRTAWRYVAIVGVATASYYLLERPLMRLGHRLAKPATPGREDLEPVKAGG